jgi:WD40 repeat protein
MRLSSDLGEDGHDVFSSRPLKRRKQSFDMPSSPPQSSPLLKVEPVNDRIEIAEDDSISVDYDDLPDLMECLEPFPKPIQRIRHTGRTHRLMQRSFGGYASTSRGFRGPEHCVDWRADTADFVTLPSDRYSFTGTALPFCTASCNTNPLVAFADEEGNIRLVDSSAGANFSQPHISFKVHRNAIMDIAFSSDDYMLATASGDQTACVVDMQTQKKMYTLSGHNGSLKQIRFHPDDDKMLTTSSRDGSVQIWDLRCSSKTASQILYPAYGSKPHTQTLYSKVSMDIGRAHRVAQGKAYAPGDLAGTSITAFQHLANDRSHLLATASEANSSIKLWDLRNAGRRGVAIPVSSTPVPEHHNRNFAISALALSGDGSRLYSVCRDSVVYAYSANHLALGCAPEMAPSYPGRRAAKEGRMGIGPLYGFKHPAMRAGSFYVRAAIRKAQNDRTEMLAIGSTDGSPVLIPTDERHLLYRINRRPLPESPGSHYNLEDDDNVELPSFSSQRPQSRSTSIAPPTERHGPPIYESHGTALLRGHTKEVTSLSFTSEGNLVTISDDFTGRCWREERESAKHLRSVGESGGERWASGWADMPASWDESDDE